MAASFLLTFDCEGKWGVVDRLTSRHRECYTTAQAESVYPGVLALLRKYRIPATFAFTAAFTMERRAFDGMRPEIRAHAEGSPWMRRALQAIDDDGGDGWFAPGCFARVQDSPMREIASHGFSHIPWGAAYATREILHAELALNRRVPGFAAETVETFIYPRNQVRHTDLLTPHGFRNYRGARRSFGRPANLMRELNLLTRSEQLGDMRGLPVAVPAGYFLNWRHGLRRCIPIPVTLTRWRHMLRHANHVGGVVHAWTHPEDFIGCATMFELLEGLLRAVAEERESGRLGVVTCQELVKPGQVQERPYPAGSAFSL